jgi:predicted transcriptional regulator
VKKLSGNHRPQADDRLLRLPLPLDGIHGDRLRERATLEQLAKYLGISIATVWRAERGMASPAMEARVREAIEDLRQTL